MLSRIWFGVCIAGIIAVLITAFFVASQYQRATEQCEKIRGSQVNASAGAAQTESTDVCEKYAERHSPGWYRIFRWTDGVTVWALILTLLVIAEQTRQTAISAEAAQSGIEIQVAGQRAWLVIRSAMEDYRLSAADQQLRFWWTLENRGKLPAQVLETQCRYELIEDDPTINLPPEPRYPQAILLDGYLIEPMGSREFYTFLQRQDGSCVVPPLPVNILERIEEGALWLRVYGYVKYIDGLERERESRFIEYYIVGPVDQRGYGFRPLLGAASSYTKST